MGNSIMLFFLASSGRIPGRPSQLSSQLSSHDGTDQPKPPGPVPIIPSPIPPTPMENQNNASLPFPSAAYTSSHQSNANFSSGLMDFTNGASPYNPRKPKVLPNSTEGPSLAEEILSNLRSTSSTTIRKSDGLPSTML